jgi:cell division protease FtsH
MPAPKNQKDKKEFGFGRFSKTLAFWALLVLVPFALVQLSGARAEASPEIDYTRYRAELARDNIARVTIQAGKTVQGEFRNPANVKGAEVKGFTTRLPMENSESEVEALQAKGVTITAQDARPSVTGMIVSFLP